MTVNVEDIEITEDSESPKFIIKTRDSGILIGENGKNFIALNHIIKKIIETKFSNEDADAEKIQFSIDINDYQARKIEELKNTARMAAQRVRYFKKDVEMNPMSSYDRRIVHSVLSEYPDITTESSGEGENRRVVIKPYGI